MITWHEINLIRKLLIELKRSHYICDDCWYSCPKSGGDNYCGRLSPDVCTCGVDVYNKKIEKILAICKTQIEAEREDVLPSKFD